MMKSFMVMAGIFSWFGGTVAGEPPKAKPESTEKLPASLHALTVKDIDGRDVALSAYRGQAVLIVNVASYCGYTPQYTALQALHEKYKDRGFTVLGFPANEFGKQEPGTNEEIKAFCTSKYAVTFPMFAKVVVKGEGKAPLFRWLTESGKAPVPTGDIAWNFEKFLINAKGELVARFKTKVKPDSEDVAKAIEAALPAR